MSTKKKKGTGKVKKRKGVSNAIISKLGQDDFNLPIIPSSRAQAIFGCVADSDSQTLSRLVVHYNHHSDINAVDCNGSTALHLACRKGNAQIVENLLSHSIIDVNQPEWQAMGGYSALHIACLKGAADCIRLLIDAGANINMKADSQLGERPLHLSCKHGQVASARMLLSAGVQTDLRDGFGHNASYWAVQKGHEKMITELDLPVSKAATAAEYFAMMVEKTKGKFVLPAIAKKKVGAAGKKNENKKVSKK